MSLEQIGDALKTVISEGKEEYHSAVFANGKIWIFARKFVNEPKYNWGHRVTFPGTYAIDFDVAEKKWGAKQQFEALSAEENAEEVIFAHNGTIFNMLFTAFGEIAFNHLFKWDGTKWGKVGMKTPEKVDYDEKTSACSVGVIVADGTSKIEKYFIVNVMGRMFVYRFTVGDSDAELALVAEVPEDLNRLRGKATHAIHAGRRLLISYGVSGCGFRWEKGSVITFDLDSKNFEHVTIPGEWSEGPPFCFAGPHASGVAVNGDWIFATGSVQIGMCGSENVGDIWTLTNLNTSPEWKNTGLVVPSQTEEKIVVIDSEEGTVYVIADAVSKVRV